VEPGRWAVLDGRDIGTVVFPEAAVKIFLLATPEARAERRLRQRGEDVSPDRLAVEAAALAARDAADSARPVAPLRQAKDAVVIDTTFLDFQAQIDAIVAVARKSLPEKH
jgi:cytidylate kinase